MVSKEPTGSSKGRRPRPPEPPIEPKFLRPKHYAKRVDINWRTAYEYIDQGVLPAYKFKGIVLLDVDECDAILKGLRK
jgi:hypothetical protein